VSWFRDIRKHPWRITIPAVVGLLVAIMIVGVVGLFVNRSVEQVASNALRYDVELEDNGDDLRVAVLDVRHYHRNITFAGPSDWHVSRFEEAYAQMHSEIDELDRLGVRDPDAPQPDEIRAMANAYYEKFRPAIALYDTDREAFEAASERGLREIFEVEEAAAEIDKLGEELSAKSLQEVDRAAATARLVLLTVIGGLLLVGAVLAYAAVRVVGELRRLYAGQRAAAERMAELSQAKTDFLADASHELRTPLTVIRGNAQIGLQLEDDCAHAELLEEIVRESGQMTRMVEDLMFLARSDSATPPLSRERTAVVPLMADVAGRAEALARERGAELELEISGRGELEADAQRIEQAVLILVDNAAKYGPPGGKVRLSSETDATNLRITVADEGPGIPEKDLPHIFDRFYRVDKTRARRLGGAGLGLPIAKTIVEAHGGRIEAQSRPGEGIRMKIQLPLLGATDLADRTAPEDVRWRTPASRG
jgi:signal transduction histidine kinase